MDSGAIILNALAESVTPMTAAMLVSATELHVATVNSKINSFQERGLIVYCGEVKGAGRYARQYTITEYGRGINESNHATMILSEEGLAHIPEQMLQTFNSLVEEKFAAMTEAFRIRLETTLNELDKNIEQLRGMTAESIALVKHAAILPTPVAEKPQPVAKKEEPAVWHLKSYMNGEDITPIVDKLKSSATYHKWLENRVVEYGFSNTDDFEKPEIMKVNEIATAAMAKHGWSI